MDHLPEVQNPRFPPVEVRYLGDEEPEVPRCDNLGFLDFPTRIGLDREQLLNGQWPAAILRSDRQVATFLQQWLYFGLLSTAFGYRYTMQTLLEDFTFTSETSGHRLISTRNLEQYLQARKESLTEEEKQPGSHAIQSFDEALIETQKHVSRYMCAGPNTNHPMSQYPEICLSIQSLGVVLTRARMAIWNPSLALGWQHSQLVLNRMSNAGWCPSDVTMLKTKLTASGLYFASQFTPRLIERNHVQEGCTEDVCEVMNISGAALTTYRPSHVEGCDKKCGLETVNEQELRNILQDGKKVPLVKYTDENEKPCLTLLSTPLDKASPYVALSHIWAEGLGNVQDNALPRCQLAWIQKLIDQVHVGEASQTPFWIDTLCVPQDNVKPNLAELRKQAILAMDQVYKNCSSVLVLDKALMSASIQNSIEERVVRLTCSSWLRRFWTLQEAVLGPKIVLQFADGAVDMMGQLFKGLEDHPNLRYLSQTILTELGEFIYRIKLLRQDSEYPLITRVWNACQFRDTSKHQDETICLSAILRNHVSPTLDARDQDKWVTFLLQQRTFPKDLLFTRGERMTREGFRWAPTTFIHRPARRAPTLKLGMGIGAATADGLTIHAQGFLFSPPRATFEEMWNGFWVLDLNAQRPWRLEHTATEGDGLPSWAELRNMIQGCQRLGLIVNQDLNRSSTTMGVIVETSAEDPGDPERGIMSRLLATVNVKLEPPVAWTTLEGWMREENEGTELPKACRTVVGNFVDGTQLWCVG